jgi:hypothetical protein
VSYEIIYNKQFVKLRKTGEVIPIFLSGSNNCFDVRPDGRTGRRARDWSVTRYYNRKGKFSEKPALILKKLDAELNKVIRDHRGRDGIKPAHIRDHFGYYTSLAVGSGSCGGTSWNMYRSQFANGIKNALTVEELAKLGVTLYFYAVTIKDNPNGVPAQRDIATEREYFTELKKWRAWHDGNGKSFWLSFHPHDTDSVLERLRAGKPKAQNEKTSVEQDHYFVLIDGSNVLVRYTSQGFQYSFYKGNGKRFRTEKEAENYRQRLLKRQNYKAGIWKVERINANATFRV